MAQDAKLMMLFGGLHLIGLALATGLLVMFIRSDTGTSWPDSEDSGDGGGGGNDRVLPKPPKGPLGGGLPLPDAAPAGVRLRDHQRLRDRLPDPPRRRTVEPVRPRIPARHR